MKKLLILLFACSVFWGANSQVIRPARDLTVWNMTVLNDAIINGTLTVTGASVFGTITVDSLINTGGATFGDTVSMAKELHTTGYLGVGTTQPKAGIEISKSSEPTFIIRETTEAVGDATNVYFMTGANGVTPAGGNIIGNIRINVTQAHPSTLKSQMTFRINTGDAISEAMRLKNDKSALFAGGVTATGTLTSSAGRIRNTTTVAAATYDLLVTDDILHVTYTGTGAVTSLTLPTAQVVDGRTIVIKDAGGGAGANNITVDTQGAETIDGAATAVISGNYDAIEIYSDGTNWFIF